MISMLSSYVWLLAPVLDSAALCDLALISSAFSVAISLHIFDHTLVKLRLLPI